MSADVVYVVGPGGSSYDELRYSLRSLANVDHGRVWIAGHLPRWVRNVGHIPTEQKLSKFRNSTANLLAACAHPDVADDFTFWNDDYFALRRTTVPTWHRGVENSPPQRQNPNRSVRGTTFTSGLAATIWLLREWGIEGTLLNYELHVPMPVDKAAMRDVLTRAARHPIEGLHKRTLYGNACGIGGREHVDVKIPQRDRTFSPSARWVSTNDRSFADGRVGRDLRRRFPDPSPYEEN